MMNCKDNLVNKFTVMLFACKMSAFLTTPFSSMFSRSLSVKYLVRVY